MLLLLLLLTLSMVLHHTTHHPSLPHHSPPFFSTAGPHYLVTPLILDILKEKKVKATFFIAGEVRWDEVRWVG